MKKKNVEENPRMATYFAIANPLPRDLADTIWWATFTIELPQAAPAPLNPSSVPNGFGGCFTLSMISSGNGKKKKCFVLIFYDN